MNNEEAGKHSKPEKRRYYLTARGSATESAAVLDFCWRLKFARGERTRAIEPGLFGIVAMLIKLAQISHLRSPN